MLVTLIVGFIFLALYFIRKIINEQKCQKDYKQKRFFEEEKRKRELELISKVDNYKKLEEKKTNNEIKQSQILAAKNNKYNNPKVVFIIIEENGKQTVILKRSNNTYTSIVGTGFTFAIGEIIIFENGAFDNYEWYDEKEYKKKVCEYENHLERISKEAEEKRKSIQDKIIEQEQAQKRLHELQKIKVEKKHQNQQISLYKNIWLDFQHLLQQNGVTRLYHFTDRANLTSIRNNGGLYSWWKADELGIEVPMPGGIGFGRDLDRRYGLQNYVRVCFTKQHPMLYIAKREGRIINPVILEIKLDVAYLRETRFSNMNATKNGHQQGMTLADLERIRFDLVLQPNHFNISQVERHFYQAEVLVLEKIPLEYIININIV